MEQARHKHIVALDAEKTAKLKVMEEKQTLAAELKALTLAYDNLSTTTSITNSNITAENHKLQAQLQALTAELQEAQLLYEMLYQ
jgi:hypothetical protein